MTSILYYKTLNDIKFKQKVVYQSKGSNRCACGKGKTIYTLYQVDTSKYKMKKKRSKCLTFSSESDEEFENTFDINHSFGYKISNNKEEQKLYDAVDSIILAKKKK